MMPFYVQASNKILKIENGIITFIAKHKDIEYTCYLDEENLHLLKEHTWSVTLTKDKSSVREVRTNSKRKWLALHRVVTKALGRKNHVDHIDGNPLNNLKQNLRICSSAQNMKNMKRMSTNTTGFKGVSYIKKLNKYRAYIVVNYKQIHLGLFDTTIDAGKAYNEAAVKYHMDFARINRI